jgi:hypothetical protein
MEDVKQQKRLLEDELKKAEQQENMGAIEELKNSVFLLDQDLNSMSKLFGKKEGERKRADSQEYVPPATGTQPIKIGSHSPNHSTHNVSASPTESATGIADKVAETSKWWMKGVSTAISSVSNYLSWGNTEVSTSPPKEYHDTRGGNYAEFEVMQINWYWRRK